MSTNQPYLKSKNTWWLRLFIGVNLAVFLSVVVGQSFTEETIMHCWQRLSAKDGLFVVCFPLVAIVLNTVLGDLGKARLVFWRWRNPLPGCRAFSVIMSADPRIDVTRLKSRLGSLPSDPKDQNAIWYRLYKSHSDKVMILEAHRAYLLTRDMTALAAVFMLSLSIAAFVISPGWKFALLYSVILSAQYLIVATSSRNYGNRFVANVLTEESHST